MRGCGIGSARWVPVATGLAFGLALYGCPAQGGGEGGQGGAPAPGISLAARDVSEELTAARRDPGDGARRIELLERALVARDQQIRELDRSLAARDAKIEDLTGAVAKLEERLEALVQKQVAESRAVEHELARLREESAKLASLLEEERRIVTALRAHSLVPNVAREVPRIEARVISVDRTSGGLPVVLLDAGRKQGVLPSFEFTIGRRGRSIAKAVVEHVEAELSGARVVYLKDGDEVREGDTATTRPIP